MKFVAAEDRERENLRRLQAEYAEMFSTLSSFQAARIGAIAASRMRGQPGAAASVADAAISINISNLEAKITDIEIRIFVSKEVIAGYQENRRLFNQRLDQNSKELRRLGCVV